MRGSATVGFRDFIRQLKPLTKVGQSGMGHKVATRFWGIPAYQNTIEYLDKHHFWTNPDGIVFETGLKHKKEP